MARLLAPLASVRKLLLPIALTFLLVFASTAGAGYRWNVVRPYNAKLKRIAGCESTWRWHLATGNGFYGGLQFTLGTWRSLGGHGYPHWATKIEQKYRAVLLFKRRGSWADWPICGYR